MSSVETAIPIDRKLHAVSRGLLTLLGSVAGVLLLVWIANAWIEGLPEELDATWFFSGAVRVATFTGMMLLSFLATQGAQPPNPLKEKNATPQPRHMRMRAVSAVCAALFFGDFTASSFAESGSGWLGVMHTVLLSLLALAAVVSLATVRSTLRLWKEVSRKGEEPVWREPTELQVNRYVPMVGSHTVWFGVFLTAWIIGDEIPPLVQMGSAASGVSFTLTLEALLLVCVGVMRAMAREMVLARRYYPWRRRLLRGAEAVFGFLLCGELGGRVMMARHEADAAIFWAGLIVAGLGASVAFWRLVPLHRTGPPSSD